MSRPTSDIQAEFHAHALHDLAALFHHVLFELERRNAEGEQSADLRIAIEHHGGDAVAHQDVGARQARGTRADDGHALVGAHDVRQVGLPTLLERLVRDVFFDGADADGAEPVIQRAGALAQPILRANASAHLGQRIRLMGELRRLEQLPVVDQRQPIRNVVVHRAFPLAKRIAARQAPAGLLRGRLGAVLRIDLAKLRGRAPRPASFSGSRRGTSRNCRYLSAMRVRSKGACYAARRRLTSSESIAAAFGFTTQNLPM